MGPSDALILDALDPALALPKYLKKTLQMMTMFCMDLFSQAQASCPKLVAYQKRYQKMQGSC